jgi:hypothetical protein
MRSVAARGLMASAMLVPIVYAAGPSGAAVAAARAGTGQAPLTAQRQRHCPKTGRTR